MRAAGDDAGKARRRPHDRGEQPQQGGVGLEQREELDAGRQPGEELVEADQRLVGAARLPEGLEQRRRKLCQPFARLGRACRPVAAEMPGADDAADVAGAFEAHGVQRLQRIWIVDVAGEDEIADAGGQFRRGFEQSRIMAFDDQQRAAERLLEASRVVVAEHAGDALQPLVVFGQVVGLLVIDHLDCVLDVAQEPVLLRQRVARLGRDPAALGEHRQHLHRRAAAQFGEPPAGDELLRLDEELDLADAATSELDVVAPYRDLAMALVGMDLALDRMDVGDRREIHVFAPDIGLQFLEERIAGPQIARDRARLDHRGALPVLAAALVIGQRRLDGDRQRR